MSDPTNNPVNEPTTPAAVLPEPAPVVEAVTPDPVIVLPDTPETNPVAPTAAESPETPAAEAAPTPIIEVVRTPREFVVGSTHITENDSTVNLTPEQVKEVLKAQFPEVANATVRERTEGDKVIVEFLPQPGRKG